MTGGREAIPALFVYNTDMARATVIGLQGDLGSGKTFFVQRFGEIVGVKEFIISPTFVLIKRYPIDWQGFKNLIHIDAYRLEHESELVKLGWNELISNKNNLIFIEWPERVKAIIPEDSKIIQFKHDN